jgi:hypothetical protein
MYRPKYVTMADALTIVRTRCPLHEGRIAFWTALREGALPTEYKADEDWLPLPPGFWSARSFHEEAFVGASAIFRSRIRIAVSYIDRLWPIAAIPSVSSEPVKKNKGGRPEEHDWDAARRAAEEFVTKNGLPAIQARMLEVVREWFVNNDGKKAPDDKMIRQKVVRPLYTRRTGQTS